MVKLYGLSNCDTTRKGLKWLKAENISHTFIPVSEITAAQARKWLKENDRILNRQSTTWRSLTAEEKLIAETDPAGLILSKPTLIKRPVIEYEEGIIAGFNAKEYETLILKTKNK